MKEVFPIIPAAAAPVGLLVGIALLLLGGAVFLGFLAFACRNASVQASSAGLDIRGGFTADTSPCHPSFSIQHVR